MANDIRHYKFNYMLSYTLEKLNFYVHLYLVYFCNTLPPRERWRERGVTSTHTHYCLGTLCEPFASTRHDLKHFTYFKLAWQFQVSALSAGRQRNLPSQWGGTYPPPPYPSLSLLPLPSIADFNWQLNWPRGPLHNRERERERERSHCSPHGEAEFGATP